MKRIFCLFIVPGLAAMSLSTSCSNSDNGNGVVSIKKVNPYYLKPGQRIETDDRMIRHEQKYHIWGAITNEEFLEKYGHYYTVHWESKQKGSPVTVRLEYTQGLTGPTVHSQEVEVPSAKRSNTTKFRVTGTEFTTNGQVTSWRISLVVGGQTVAESKSFLWK